MSMGGIAGVILAGGRASRMGGGDKCLHLLGGEPLLSHVIRRLAPQVEGLALNANGDPARFRAFGLPVIADAGGELKGPLAGILAGFNWAARTGAFTHVLTVAADTPFVPQDLVARLAACAGDGRRIAVATSAGRPHPVFALWPPAVRDDLVSFLSEDPKLKVMDFAARHDPTYVEFPPHPAGASDFDSFFNINTFDDLEAAEAIWAEQQP